MVLESEQDYSMWRGDAIWGGLGLIGDIIVGLVGAVIAGYLLPRVGVYVGAGFVPDVIQRGDWSGCLVVIVRLGKGLMPAKA
jgi:uncharacterized membrane protein YeaQ/YmgE (transglycosylase-associated protein family)